MATEFYFFFAFALFAFLFVFLVSIGIVINKMIVGRRMRIRDHQYDAYSNLIAATILAEHPEGPSDATVALSKSQRVTLDRIRVQWKSMGRRKREISQRAMKDVLIDFAKDVSGESLEVVTSLFEFFGFVDVDIDLLANRKWWIRAQAARDLGSMRVRRAIKHLVAILSDENHNARNEAIRALTSIVGVRALQTIFGSTGQLSQWTALELSVVVMRFGETAIPFLIRALNSRNHSVVLFSIEMLSEIGFVQAVEPLLRVAETYPDVSVRAKAFEALGRLGDERAEPLLREQVNNPIPELRVGAIKALGHIGSPAAVPSLEERLHKGGIKEKLDAARAMGSSGEQGTRRLLTLAEQSVGSTQAVVLQVLEELRIAPDAATT